MRVIPHQWSRKYQSYEVLETLPTVKRHTFERRYEAPRRSTSALDPGLSVPTTDGMLQSPMSYFARCFHPTRQVFAQRSNVHRGNRHNLKDIRRLTVTKRTPKSCLAYEDMQ